MKKKLRVPLYFVLKKGRSQPRLYESVAELCRKEDLGKSKFQKHFGKQDWYRDSTYEIWQIYPHKPTKD